MQLPPLTHPPCHQSCSPRHHGCYYEHEWTAPKAHNLDSLWKSSEGSRHGMKQGHTWVERCWMQGQQQWQLTVGIPRSPAPQMVFICSRLHQSVQRCPQPGTHRHAATTTATATTIYRKAQPALVTTENRHWRRLRQTALQLHLQACTRHRDQLRSMRYGWHVTVNERTGPWASQHVASSQHSARRPMSRSAVLDGIWSRMADMFDTSLRGSQSHWLPAINGRCDGRLRVILLKVVRRENQR